MKKVVVITALLVSGAYAGVKEDVEKDLYNCSVKEIQKEFSFANKSASGVKMACEMCATDLRNHYDLNDQNAERDYVKQFTGLNTCDRDMLKKIYKAVNGK